MNIAPSSLHIPLRQQLSQCLQLGNRSNSSPLLLLRQHQQQQRRLLSSCRTLRSAGTSNSRAAARQQQQAAQRRSIAISAVGIVACAVAMYGVIHMDMFAIPEDNSKKSKQDGATGGGGIKLDGPKGIETNPMKVKIEKPHLLDGEEDGTSSVPTGNSAVPSFPEKIHLPSTLDTSISPTPPVSKAGDTIPEAGPTEEYQLLGLGIRTVSFLSIQVYVVGLYIAQADIPVLQQRLIRQAVVPPTSNSSVGQEGTIAATSLVPAEREDLQKMLLDPELSEKTWDLILKEGGIRSAIRIVPTRNTDFLHLRDGWVRSVTAKAQKASARVKEAGETGAAESEFNNESFGNSMGEFKTLFGGGVRKNVPKGQTLLLLRDRNGVLDSLIQPGKKEGLQWLGRVSDERISRLLWMVYLSGKTVASEGARQSVVNGMMEIVRRPVGTLS
ncbi:Altered inheritance of mitochondria protein 18 mitochondrial [Arachnomyces sp. PD_36]|nr:Altered inheritance of mitochondria protein 18 mitochondrial [Arachnomyces sp. PD_36]